MSDPNNEHFLNPRPAVGYYELVDGLAIEGSKETEKTACVREITGEEEELFASRGPALDRLNQVIANCTQSIGETKCDGNIAIIRNLTATDRLVLLLAARQASLGNVYTIQSVCPECQYEEKLNVYLDKLDRRGCLDGERNYSVEISGGRKVELHVMNGKDEEWLQKALKKMKNEGKLTLMLMCRVDRIGDHYICRDLSKSREFFTSVKTLSSLGIRDRQAIRNAFKKHEGNIDLTLELECASCHHSWETELDVTETDFFFPSEM